MRYPTSHLEGSMLSVRLDKETEKHLAELLSQASASRSQLIKDMINNHWQANQPCQSILDRRGGLPRHMLIGNPGLASQPRSKRILAIRLQVSRRP